MMKKIKKTLVFAAMMVMLICSCMPVAAATDGVNACSHSHLSMYDKIFQYREFLYTHTEHNGTSTVTCNVYRDYFVVRYRCDSCGYITATTNVYEDIHVK